MYSDLTLMKMATTQMEWAARRQEVLAENVANADTPEFQPHDIKPVNFKEALSGTTATVQPAVTNAMHVANVPHTQALDVDRVRQPFESAPDGNAVILEEQMRLVGETRNAYEVATTLLTKNMKMIKTAIGKGG